ncbi:MAG: histidinol-phosphate transaminase [Actinomycetaceae bacterium]|nr:histidinol-phosphate transaminase [Arcanobacterium sp.]MDD7505382.1 histidinol-phosphate transaminase [Actinomycetaceae bacterium]MDY6142936.1 histidinol-phosphate transaminase [Arcanobacterium sp.]
MLPVRQDLKGEKPYGAPQLSVPVRLNVNENPYSPSAQVQADIASAVGAAARQLNRYPDRDFLPLREALANYLEAEAQVLIDPTQIWAANGSNEIMLHILQAFAGPGRYAATFAPSYSMYPEYARDTFTQWVSGTRNADFSLNLAEVGRILDDYHPAVVFLASPNNPTGTALDLATLRSILELTRSSGPLITDMDGETTSEARASTIVVVDEAYAEFRREGVPSALELVADYPHVIVTRTASKAFGAAGLRLGYMAAHRDIIDQLMLVRLPYHLSSITQAAALAALSHSSELLEQVGEIRTSRDAMAAELVRRGFDVAPSDANFIFFGTFSDVHAAWQGLLERGVLVRDVGYEGRLRVSIGTPHENEIFLKALAEVTR